MARSVLVSLVSLAALLLFPSTVRADECTPAAKATWGGSRATPTTSTEDTSPLARARDLIARAKFLDEAAAADDKAAADLVVRLPQLRLAAKAARERAEHAPNDAALVAKGEELEADITIGEADLVARRKSAAENRRVARDLRTRAVRIVRDSPVDETPVSSCDPPYGFTSDGRKTYRLECLR